MNTPIATVQSFFYLQNGCPLAGPAGVIVLLAIIYFIACHLKKKKPHRNVLIALILLLVITWNSKYVFSGESQYVNYDGREGLYLRKEVNGRSVFEPIQPAVYSKKAWIEHLPYMYTRHSQTSPRKVTWMQGIPPSTEQIVVP